MRLVYLPGRDANIAAVLYQNKRQVAALIGLYDEYANQNTALSLSGFNADRTQPIQISGFIDNTHHTLMLTRLDGVSVDSYKKDYTSVRQLTHLFYLCKKLCNSTSQ